MNIRNTILAGVSLVALSTTAQATVTSVARNSLWETAQSTTATGALESCFIRTTSPNSYLWIAARVGDNRIQVGVGGDALDAKNV